MLSKENPLAVGILPVTSRVCSHADLAYAQRRTVRSVAPRAAFLCTAVLLLAAGCTVLTSERPDQIAADGRMAVGVHYALPKGLVNFELFVDNGKGHFFLDVSDPEFHPDSDHRYVMRYRPLPNYHDQLTIEINSKSFIRKAYVTTKDETPTIIQNLARAFGALRGFEAAPPTGAQVKSLGRLSADPSDPKAVDNVRRVLNRAASNFAAKAAQACAAQKAPEAPPPSPPAGANLPVPPAAPSAPAATPPAAKQPAYDPRCPRMKSAALGGDIIELGVQHPRRIAAGAVSDCTTGLCYRIKEPYIITYSVGGRRFVKIVEVPNKAALIELDITRAALVTKIQNIDFDETGFLQSVHIDKPSELVAASKLPLDIVDAVLDGMQIRIDLITEQRNYALKQAAALEAEAKLLAAARPSEQH